MNLNYQLYFVCNLAKHFHFRKIISHPSIWLSQSDILNHRSVVDMWLKSDFQFHIRIFFIYLKQSLIPNIQRKVFEDHSWKPLANLRIWKLLRLKWKLVLRKMWKRQLGYSGYPNDIDLTLLLTYIEKNVVFLLI